MFINTNIYKPQTLSNKIYFIFYLFSVFFLGLQHVEVPMLGVESELQLLATPQSEQLQIQAMSTTYTTAQGNVGSLTH